MRNSIRIPDANMKCQQNPWHVYINKNTLKKLFAWYAFGLQNSYWKGIQNTSKSTLKSRFWRCAICFLKLFGLCPCVMHCWASVMPAPNVRISSLINITLVGINEIQLVWQTWTKWNPAIVKWGIGINHNITWACNVLKAVSQQINQFWGKDGGWHVWHSLFGKLRKYPPRN